MKRILIVASILFLGLSLRLCNLGKYPLWHDEASVALETRGPMSLPEITKFFSPKFSINRQDYLFLYNHAFIYGWKHLFGNSEYALRSSSVLFGLLSLLCVYFFAAAIYDQRIGLMALFLMAVSPMHIYYSQELKPYTLITFLSIMAFFSLFKMMQRGRRGWWFLYAVCNILNIYSNYMMIAVLLAEMLVFVVNGRERRILTRFILVNLAVFATIIPVLLIIIPNIFFALSHRTPVDIADFPIWAQRVGFENILFTIKNFSAGYNIDFYSVVGFLAVFAYVFLFFMGFYADTDRRRKLSLLIMVAFPIGLIFLISFYVKVCYVDRYFISSLPVFLILVAAGMYHYNSKLRYCFILITIVISLYGIRGYHKNILPLDYSQRIGVFSKETDIIKTAGFISENFEKGDKVFVSSKLLTFPLKFYLQYRFCAENNSFNEACREISNGRLFWLDDRNKLMYFTYKDAHPDLEPPKEFSGGNFPRIWVLCDSADPKPDIIRLVLQIYPEKRRYIFKNLELFLFTKRR